MNYTGTRSFDKACAYSALLSGSASYVMGQYNVLVSEASDLQVAVGAIGMGIGWLGVGFGLAHLLLYKKKDSNNLRLARNTPNPRA